MSSDQANLEALADTINNGDSQTAQAAVQQCYDVISNQVDDSRYSQTESSGGNSKGDD